MKTYRLIAAAMAVSCSLAASSQLVINELMQSNIDCVMDDLNEFPDSWVELHNAGSAAVNLADYAISLTPDPATAWKLPAQTVAPGGKVVVWCDKAATGLHTDFRLETAKGGAVYLFAGSECADKVEGMKKQPAPNIAYGREADGAATWGYQASPTPGAANCGKVLKTVCPDPMFSVAGSVCSSAFSLSLSLPEGAPAGSVIRFTTDGTEPTSKSQAWTGPLTVSRTTTVRAVVMAEGCLTPRSVAQSYIFFPREMTLPIVEMTTDSRWLNDAKVGIFAGENYKQDWRRPVNLELFMKPGEPAVFNQLCETRIKGGYTRQINPLKSMVVYANKRFGMKRFTCEFFPQDAPGLSEWKSFELRDSGNDFDYLYFRDALVQRMMGRNADLDWQPWQPAVFMINGEYKGILNIRPRSNEDHVYTFYNELEDIDMLENWAELKVGDRMNYDAFRAFYAEVGHTFAEYEKWMDTGEYANLMLMNLFADNRDFPGNNIVMWRPRTPEGRWRWIAKDCDFGFGLYGGQPTYNTIEWLYNNNYDPNSNWGNTPDATRLFRRLMETAEFKEMFSNRVAVYLGDFMSAASIKSELDAMRSVIAAEYPNHRALFNPWWPNYNDEVNAAKRWIDSRVTTFINYYATFFKLGTPTPLTVGASERVKFTVNGIELHGGAFDGRFYQGSRLTVSGTAEAAERAVKGWKVTVKTNSGTTVTDYEGATLDMTFPACNSVSIQAVMGESGLEEISDSSASLDPNAPTTVTDLSGRTLGTYPDLHSATTPLTPGVYILRQGHKVVKQAVR